MLVPNANRLAVYKALFKAGVLCAPKNVYKPEHDDIAVPNLHGDTVIKLMQSLVSRGYARERFSWQWYYWFLTDEGIEYLRNYLHLSEEVKPDTLMKQNKPLPRLPASMGGRREYGDRTERGEYRSGPRRGFEGEKKMEGAPSDFKPEFRSGFGRGSRQA